LPIADLSRFPPRREKGFGSVAVELVKKLLDKKVRTKLDLD